MSKICERGVFQLLGWPGCRKMGVGRNALKLALQVAWAIVALLPGSCLAAVDEKFSRPMDLAELFYFTSDEVDGAPQDYWGVGYYQFFRPAMGGILHSESRIYLEALNLDSVQYGWVLHGLHNGAGNMAGVSLFYDYRKGEGGGVHQISLGGEGRLGPFQVGVEFYVPVGSGSHILSSYFWDDYDGDYWVAAQKREEGFFGGAMIFGLEVPWPAFSGLKLFVRPYRWLSNWAGATYGSFWGARVNISPLWTLDVGTSWDRVFGHRSELRFSIRGGVSDPSQASGERRLLGYHRSRIPVHQACYYQMNY